MSTNILAAHTSAPWEVIREDDYDGPSATTFVKHIGPFHIEWHDDLNKGNPERIEADIALASAAPDLLAALKYARRNVKPSECDIAFIDAAIAKASPC